MQKREFTQGGNRYGAFMGRSDLKGDPDTGGKFSLRRVYLDRGGYDAGGAYWGAPSDLWAYDAQDDADISGFLRAKGRASAKAQVVEMYPNARFFR